jgi:hypothetical protein
MSKLLTQSAEISEFPPESSQIVEVVFLVDLARFRCQLFLDEVENGISQLEFTKKIALDFQNTLHLVTIRQFVYVVVMETLSNRRQTNSAKFKIFTTERGQMCVARRVRRSSSSRFRWRKRKEVKSTYPTWKFALHRQCCGLSNCFLSKQKRELPEFVRR